MIGINGIAVEAGIEPVVHALPHPGAPAPPPSLPGRRAPIRERRRCGPQGTARRGRSPRRACSRCVCSERPDRGTDLAAGAAGRRLVGAPRYDPMPDVLRGVRVRRLRRRSHRERRRDLGGTDRAGRVPLGSRLRRCAPAPRQGAVTRGSVLPRAARRRYALRAVDCARGVRAGPAGDVPRRARLPDRRLMWDSWFVLDFAVRRPRVKD